MRALTVLQPFATALVREGMKTIENRPMPFPSTVPLPTWVAIHAGARPFPDEDLGGAALLWLPMRRVVGAVRFVRSVHVVDLDHDDPWASGPWCWVRDLCVEIEEAPDVRGSQGLWSLNGYTDLALIREAIAAKYGNDEAARAVGP